MMEQELSIKIEFMTECKRFLDIAGTRYQETLIDLNVVRSKIKEQNELITAVEFEDESEYRDTDRVEDITGYGHYSSEGALADGVIKALTHNLESLQEQAGKIQSNIMVPNMKVMDKLQEQINGYRNNGIKTLKDDRIPPMEKARDALRNAKVTCI
jgi:hypothetical protein